MKIRNGFVSNSSSSSFLIYGTIVDREIGENVELLNGLDVNYPDPNYDEDYVYVGKSWDMIKDNETGLQFKQSIETELKRVFGEDTKCGTHEESYYNG